ncbi:MAG: 2-amino-4-hydroxy-6-hydroxymethyldihydropteridine diphosphokinase [Bacteroidota bacterium]
MNEVYLLLGSNEGNRLNWMQNALEQIGKLCGPVILTSSVYQTSAWGLEAQPDFLNVVLLIHTTLTPSGLLSITQSIEASMGRQRDIKWGQRSLDIDILYYGHQIVSLSDLQVPHPYISTRRFTLIPLCEIAPSFLHPTLQKTSIQLLDECSDPLEVQKFSGPLI